MDKRGANKPGRYKNFVILFLVLIIFLGFVYLLYQTKINTTVAELIYPSNVTYDFESDTIGEHPTDWSGTRWSGTEVILWTKDESYGQVAEVENRDGEGVEIATRFKKAESGVIEFDIYCDYNERVGIDITQPTEDYDPVDDICIHLGGSDNAIKIKNGNNIFVKVYDFIPKQWYHFKIEFNIEYWQLWIDGEQILICGKPYIDYYELPSHFCQLYFSTYISDNRFYIDNVEIIVTDKL